MSHQHGTPRSTEPLASEVLRHRSPKRRAMPGHGFWERKMLGNPRWALVVAGRHPDRHYAEEARYVRWLYRNANPQGVVT